jgi:hypothetical protein
MMTHTMPMNQAMGERGLGLMSNVGKSVRKSTVAEYHGGELGMQISSNRHRNIAPILQNMQ